MGKVEKVDRKESEEYHGTRPRGSQLGAWASPQSRVVGEGEVGRLVKEVEERFEGEEKVGCPEYWGGWRLIPLYVLSSSSFSFGSTWSISIPSCLCDSDWSCLTAFFPPLAYLVILDVIKYTVTSQPRRLLYDDADTRSEVEFWCGQPSRLHDRFRYTRAEPAKGEEWSTEWKIDRLAP